MNKLTLLTIFVLAIFANAQTSDQSLSYNVTYINQVLTLDKLQFCKVPSPNGKQCQTCFEGFQKIPQGLCLLPKIPQYCYGVDICNNCVLCHDGYYINWGIVLRTCTSKKIGCENYDLTAKKCRTCLPGYLMNTTANPYSNQSEYFCYFVPDQNCISYDNKTLTTCLQCASNYILSNNQCVYWVANCEVMSEKICKKCLSNFYLDNSGNCAQIPKISNCVNQIDFTCNSCVSGYVLASNQCLYFIENCQLLNGLVCSQCNAGYFVNNQGKCSPIPKIPNCAIQVDLRCSSCENGFRLQNNKCVFFIQNCNIVEGMVCSQCASGYSVNVQGKCIQIPKILNCGLQVDYTCQQCTNGYRLFNNQCILIIANCLQYSGQVCTKCVPDYVMTSSGQCIVISKIQNCATQTGITCKSCLSGYNLLNNMCIYFIQNCLKVNLLSCVQCAQNYMINVQGKCSAQSTIYDPNCRVYDNSTFTKCIKCSNGFFLNVKMLCEQVDPLCQGYNGNNGFCLNCYTGYALEPKTGKCFKSNIDNFGLNNCNQFDYIKNICIKCAEGNFFDQFGKCQKFNDLNCKIPSMDLKSCLQCYKGYNFNPSQKKCIVSNFNCATWKDGKCGTCPQGYYLNEVSNCVQIDSLCRLFNPIIKMCMICYPGYAFDTDRKCKQIGILSSATKKFFVNCAKFNQNNQCIQCYNGFYVAQDTTGYFCQKVNDLCKTYSNSSGKCTSCYLGYYLSTLGQCGRYY